METKGTVWCLKAVNGFTPSNGLTNGYFGSADSLSEVYAHIEKNYPNAWCEISYLDPMYHVDKPKDKTSIVIEECPF